MRAGSIGKVVLGAAFVQVSVAILPGFDKVAEAGW